MAVTQKHKLQKVTRAEELYPGFQQHMCNISEKILVTSIQIIGQEYLRKCSLKLKGFCFEAFAWL